MIQFCHGSERDLEGMNKVHKKITFQAVWKTSIHPSILKLWILHVHVIEFESGFTSLDMRYSVYSKLESLLAKVANSERYEEESKLIVDFYKEGFNAEQLKLQLNIVL